MALSAVYAYCRLIDDIVDSEVLPRDDARRMLAFWREEIERLYVGAPTQPAAARLLEPVRVYRLPKLAFLEVIRGCEMDLEKKRYETFEELASYMDGVAVAVGTLSLEIFGHEHTPKERLSEFAKFFGYAFQLTNIIRDVGADLDLGRIYIPLSDMREAGYSPEALSRRERNPAFQRLMEAQCLRARGFYQKARSLLDFRDRPKIFPAEIMAHIYEGLLEEMRRTGFRVLRERARLSPWRKFGLAGKAWLYCHGL